MNKVSTITLLLFFITLHSKAQINKGDIQLGGGIGFGTAKTEDTEQKRREISISPAFGFTIKDNRVLGIRLRYAALKIDQTTMSPDLIDNAFYGAGIFYRKYYPLGKNFYIFGEGGSGYSYSRTMYRYGTVQSNTTRADVVDLYIEPGINYAVSKHFLLEASLNQFLSVAYSAVTSSMVTSGIGSIQKSRGFSFNANASNIGDIHIGFRIIL